MFAAYALGGMGATAPATTTLSVQGTIPKVIVPNTVAANSAVSSASAANNLASALSSLSNNAAATAVASSVASSASGTGSAQASASSAQNSASAAASAAQSAISAAQTAVSAAQSVASSSSQPVIIASDKMFDDDKGIGMVRTIGRNNLIQRGGNDLNQISAAVNTISNIPITNTGTVVSSPVSSMAFIGKDGFDDKFGLMALNSISAGLDTTAQALNGLSNTGFQTNIGYSNTGTNVFNDLGLTNTLSNSYSNINTPTGLLGVSGQSQANSFFPSFGFGMGKMDGKFFLGKFD